MPLVQEQHAGSEQASNGPVANQPGSSLPKRPSLRKSRRFAEKDIPSIEQEPTETKRRKVSKYNPAGEGEPDFMAQMKELAAKEDPPIYSAQGEDIGKKCGWQEIQEDPKDFYQAWIQEI